MAHTIERLQDVNRHDSCASRRLLPIKAVDSRRDDRKERGGARPERPKAMLRASKRNRRGSDVREKETLENLDGWGEKRDGAIRGAKIGWFTGLKDRDNVGYFPDGG